MNSEKFICSGGQKGGGLGEGIFARPRFSVAAEFRASKAGAPPINSSSVYLQFCLKPIIQIY